MPSGKHDPAIDGSESIEQYYRRTDQSFPPGIRDAAPGHFNVKRRSYTGKVFPCNRKDFYKISLIIGKGVYRTEEKEIQINQPCLFFFNRIVASSWESTSEDQQGYLCLFNDDFIRNILKQNVKYSSPLFNAELQPFLNLDEEGLRRFSYYFSEMEMLLNTTYPHRFDMIRNLLLLILHESIRIQQGMPETGRIRSTDRLVNGFLDMLDQQFPVDSPESPLRLATPAIYAERLNVHVNHLNAMVKKHTGKPTREIIKEKIIAEAQKLLQHTDWDAAQIGYSLGFEYPSHFHKYFKQHAGISPQAFRQENR